jgi:hypothetical protein
VVIESRQVDEDDDSVGLAVAVLAVAAPEGGAAFSTTIFCLVWCTLLLGIALLLL